MLIPAKLSSIWCSFSRGLSMKQHEAVIKVMEENGGFATLGHLYQNVLKIPECQWKTKTPFASIRRIVQEHPEIFKIKPGLWALKEFENSLPKGMIPEKSDRQESDKFNHTYFQGLLVEIGRLNKFDTFVPAQDKNKKFLGKYKLGELANISDIYKFGYDRFISKAKTVDVIWFNERQMPYSLFEVEHSTNITNSLLKYVELQDFRTQMHIVADEARKREFYSTLEMVAFAPIKKLVSFLSYEALSQRHTDTFRAKIQ